MGLRRLTFWACLFLSSLSHAVDITVYDFKGECAPILHPRVVDEYVSRGVVDRVYNPENAGVKTREPYDLTKGALTFFEQEFNWVSWDGSGKPLFVYTNLSRSKDGECDSYNASFAALLDEETQEPDIGVMAVLLGDPDSDYHAGRDPDVIAHELGHGLVGSTRMGRGFSSEEIAKFEGALNESISDFFGIAFKAWRKAGGTFDGISLNDDSYWVGRQYQILIDNLLCGNQHPACGDNRKGIRFAKDPYVLGDPGHMRDVTTSQEHTFAGVPNLALYLIAEGGHHPRYRERRVTGIGIEKTVRILHYMIKYKLIGPGTTMSYFAHQFKKAAAIIHGVDSDAWVAANNAFYLVGMIRRGSAEDYEAHRQPEPEPRQEPETPAPAEPQPEPEPEQPAEENSPAPTQSETPTSAPQTTDSPTTETEVEESSVEEGDVNYGPILLGILVLFPILLLVFLTLAGRSAANAQNNIKDPEPFENDREPEDKSKPITPSPNPEPAPSETNKHVFRVSTNSANAEVFCDIIVTKEQKIIGRTSNPFSSALSDVLLNDLSVSREHFHLWADKGLVYFRCNSSNGMFINTHKLGQDEKAKLSEYLQFDVKLGHTTLSFQKIEQ